LLYRLLVAVYEHTFVVKVVVTEQTKEVVVDPVVWLWALAEVVGAALVVDEGVLELAESVGLEESVAVVEASVLEGEGGVVEAALS